jgi:hypothetical protein
VLFREEGVTIQRVKTWKSSQDPQYAAKKARIEQLYAIADREAVPEDDDPEIVFCVDEFGPLNLQPRPRAAVGRGQRQGQASITAPALRHPQHAHGPGGRLRDRGTDPADRNAALDPLPPPPRACPARTRDPGKPWPLARPDHRRAVTMSDRLTDRLISPPAPATAGKRADTHAETSAEASTQRDAGRRRPRPSALTDTEREAIHAAVDALPPMTDEQIDAIAEVIIAATRTTTPHPPAAEAHRYPRMLTLPSDADTHSLASDPEAGRWPAIMKCN